MNKLEKIVLAILASVWILALVSCSVHVHERMPDCPQGTLAIEGKHLCVKLNVDGTYVVTYGDLR